MSTQINRLNSQKSTIFDIIHVSTYVDTSRRHIGNWRQYRQYGQKSTVYHPILVQLANEGGPQYVLVLQVVLVLELVLVLQLGLALPLGDTKSILILSESG